MVLVGSQKKKIAMKFGRRLEDIITIYPRE
jgi:hypothetical protein